MWACEKKSFEVDYYIESSEICYEAQEMIYVTVEDSRMLHNVEHMVVGADKVVVGGAAR